MPSKLNDWFPKITELGGLNGLLLEYVLAHAIVLAVKLLDCADKSAITYGDTSLKCSKSTVWL